MLVSYGSHGVAQLADGTRVHCKYRRQVGRPYCGDQVTVRLETASSGVVERIHARRNRFVRADRHQRQKAIAANLDRAFIVIAIEPLPSQDLLERYLLAVHSLDIEPVIVLNKVDLGEPDPGAPGGRVIGRLPAYRRLGYEVLKTSCKGPPGTSALEPLLRGSTGILVGQSGVGKSSLVHRLLPDLDIQTGELSRVTGKGTHTTTTTILYQLPSGGHLMDSPGVWEYGLWKFEPAEIAAGFREFTPFGEQCRFNDCRHQAEPGCAVKDALERGQIADWRYASYLRLQAQNETV